MAIEWVHMNIGNFGGDPNRILLFGQSAGASSADLYSYAASTSLKKFGAYLIYHSIPKILSSVPLPFTQELPHYYFRPPTTKIGTIYPPI
jgi:acetyl esterase/lipase